MEMDEDSYDDQSADDEPLEDQVEAEQKIYGIIQAIQQDPWDFANYQLLIDLYRQCGMLAELREARERVHSMYCLPVDMWVEWLEDEEKLLSPEEDCGVVVELYEKALKDYKYYKVCKKYTKFVLNLYFQGKVD